MSSRENTLEKLRTGGDSNSGPKIRMPEISIPAFDLSYLGDPLSKFKSVLGELHSDVI